MQTYISGRITGLPLDTATHNFKSAETRLRLSGHTPVNPMELVPYDPALTWEDYMIADIRALFSCDAIFMLSNWKESRGARIEHHIAAELGLVIIYDSYA